MPVHQIDPNPTIYLFQIDTAENNDAFFRAKSPSPNVVFYRGAGFQVGKAPWIPDGVRVDIRKATPVECSLALIELEERKSEALKSSRKYLPENSNTILSLFRKFLRQKIDECKRTADRREEALIELEKNLNDGSSVLVKTVGALRSSDWTSEVVEELPLIDQPGAKRASEVPSSHFESRSSDNPTVIFRGYCRLDGRQNQSLRRCLAVLDAVVRKDDHSRATYHAWSQKSPLRSLLKREAGKRPALERFINPSAPNSGISLDIEPILAEMVDLWSESVPSLDLEHIRNLVSSSFRIIEQVRSYERERIDRVFEKIRPLVTTIPISDPKVSP